MFLFRDLSRGHDLVLYTCCLLSFLGVAFNGVGPLSSVLFLAVCVGSWVLQRRDWAGKIAQPVWNTLILGSVAFTGLMMYLSEESIIIWGIRFILMLVAIKLMSRRGGERDDWQIYALTFLLMAAGTAVNEDLIYGVVFALYVFLGTFGLALLHMRTEQERHGVVSQLALNQSYGRILAALSGVVLLSSATIFFTFPRVGLGFFATKARAPTSMTGFSDNVELGSHGVIRDNPEVVLRVKFADNVMPAEAVSYHWRMMSFDVYDGVKWQRSKKENRAQLSRHPNDGPGERAYDPRELYHPTIRALLSQPARSLQVYMEPLRDTEQTPQIWPMSRFSLPRTVGIPFDPSAAWAQYDTFYGDIYVLQRNELGFSYTMDVVPSPERAPMAQITTYDERDLKMRAPYLQMPDGMERLKELSAQVTRDAPSPYEKAAALESYLKDNYSYTTNLPPVDRANPLEGFLFDTRTGHCEFFASAMTIMLRSQGVPARLVNGFLGGVWNPTGEYMAVRQGDAHSWVEVYIPGHGWIPFDPTPGEGTTPLVGNPFTQTLRDVYDAARMRWMQWIIEYDLGAQVAALRRLGQMLSPSRDFSGGGSSDAQEEQRAAGPDDALTRRLFAAFVLLLITLASARQAHRERHATPSRPRRALATTLLWMAIGGAWGGWYGEWEVWSLCVGAGAPLVGALLAWRARSSRSEDATRRANLLFLRIERAARKRGVIRERDEGPSSFFRRLGAAIPEHEALITELARLYLQLRFGTSSPSADTIARLDALGAEALSALNRKTN